MCVCWKSEESSDTFGDPTPSPEKVTQVSLGNLSRRITRVGTVVTEGCQGRMLVRRSWSVTGSEREGFIPSRLKTPKYETGRKR